MDNFQIELTLINVIVLVISKSLNRIKIVIICNMKLKIVF